MTFKFLSNLILKARLEQLIIPNSNFSIINYDNAAFQFNTGRRNQKTGLLFMN